MVAVVLALTAEVVTAKKPLDSPAGTVTLAGTLAACGWLLDSATETPPGGAAWDIRTPAIGAAPAVTLGVTATSTSDGTTGGDTVTVNDRSTKAGCASVSRSVNVKVPAVVGVPPMRTSPTSALSW